jgi:hypothetical protein
MKSEIPQFSEESAKRAAGADQPSKPIEPEIVEESPEVNIDPAVMHGLMVVMVKGLVLRIDHMAGWKEHPNDEWCESTTQVVEILIEKYGGIGTSPEALLCFNLLVWMAPNLLAAEKPKPKSKDASTATAAETPKTETPAAGPSEPVYTPDLSPFEDAVA